MKTIYKPKRCKACIRTTPISHKTCSECDIKTQNPYMFKGFLLSSAKNTEGHYVDILQGIYSLLFGMRQSFDNLLIVNMVVKFPHGFKQLHDNELFLKFLDNFSSHCRDRSLSREYLWVRERSMKTGQFHYHLLLVFSLDQLNNFKRKFHIPLRLWADCLDVNDAKGLISLWTPGEVEEKYGGVWLRRSYSNYNDIFASVFTNATYLAKVYSKGYSAYKLHEFGMSIFD